MTLISTARTDKPRAGRPQRRLRRVAIRPLLLVVVVLVRALGLAACGPEPPKARPQRGEVGYGRGVTASDANVVVLADGSVAEIRLR